MNLGTIDITTPEHVKLHFKTAGLGSRSAALLFDSVILFGGALLLVFAVGIAARVLPGAVINWVVAGGIIAYFLINWFYFAFFEYFGGGQTPGKRVVGLQTLGRSGESLTLLSSLIRNFLRLINMALPIFYVLDIVMLFLHSRHQRVGDLAAGTIVVYKEKGLEKTKTDKRLLRTMQDRLMGVMPLQMEELTKKKFTYEDWQLIQAYAMKSADLSPRERWEYSHRIAARLLPKCGIQPEAGMNMDWMLLALFLALRGDWELVHLHMPEEGGFLSSKPS
ncbi:MAG: RDD family protein [Peptococcaceae bacterium]|nr:RDD family protein [Peptococcaceae bacterium]